MKRLRPLLTVLLMIFLYVFTSCKDEAIEDDPFLDADRFIHIAFCVTDDDGNDLLELWYKENCIPEIQTITGRFITGPIGSDTSVLCTKVQNENCYMMTTSIAEAVLKMRNGNIVYQVPLFKDDIEKIEISCDKNSTPSYDSWLYKGHKLQQHVIANEVLYFVTLVRHDDGTYTLKE